MHAPGESIDGRLEGLKQDDHRMTFDSKLRAFRGEDSPPVRMGTRDESLSGDSSERNPVDQMIALLEDLSLRIDGLEKKDRALADEIRQRARMDRRRRKLILAAMLSGLAAFVTCWRMGWV